MMTEYYNINTQEVKSKPTSARTSNLWLNQEQLLAEGWRPITTVYEDIGVFGYYYGTPVMTYDATTATRTYPAVRKTLANMKTYLKQQAKTVAEDRLRQQYGYFEAISRALGLIGAPAQTALENDLTTYIIAYQTFASEVDGAGTWAALETVYNNYPQLKD